MQSVNMFFFIFVVFYSPFVTANKMKGETLVDNILSEIQKLKTRQTKLEELVTHLQFRNDNLEKEMSALRHEQVLTKGNNAIPKNGNEGNQSDIDISLQKRESSGQVAFTVGVTAGDLTHLADHDTIVFDKAISNIGNAFNTNTGIFQAPLTGTYVFTLTMMVLPRHSEYLEIVVDGTFINDIFADASSIGDIVSTTKQWILQLNGGSRVWIRTSGYENNGDIHGHMHTLFSGFLLYEMA